MHEVLRQEKKYLLTLEEYHRCKYRFDMLLREDTHNGPDGYRIRSLYFDTPYDRDFEEKEDGLEVRRKIRLRNYGPEEAFGLLEMKQKQGNHQKKRSLRMKRQDAIELCRGNYGVLLSYPEEFAAECYGLMLTHQYRPKVAMEYNRKAYVAKENRIRVTLDSRITATEGDMDIFSEKLNMYPVISPYHVVLEIKYQGFLLSYIKDIVSCCEKSPTSVSKYCLSRCVSRHYKF